MFLKIIRKKAFITAIEDNKIVLLRLNDILFCVDKPLLPKGCTEYYEDNVNKIL